ncbi:hypothetical protein ACFO9Q_15175 [Paenibacillus sp. GCM10023252]|uniref:hypothetical protein n=1 Tax=Paenibacillus sp. GCM10023252 TaxID=3252649 RepID=UPI003607D8B0
MEDVINNYSFLSRQPDTIKSLLVHFGTGATRFRQWFLDNQTKIISKLRGARGEEDLYDVITELRCASFLLALDEVIELQYEPFHQTQRSPDFRARTRTNGDVYFEVRRIRRTSAEVKREQFINLFWGKAKSNIRRNFGLGLDTSSIDRSDQFEVLIQRIEEIIVRIDSFLSELPEEFEEPMEILLDEFVNGLKVYISSIPEYRRIHNEIRNYGGLFATPFSGNEYKKFGDIIFEKTHQLLDGEKNVIFIYADNETHESYDMMDSIASINQLIREANESIVKDKGYESINDFLAKSRRISGMLLLTNTQERKFWINRNSEHLINEELKNEFEGNS